MKKSYCKICKTDTWHTDNDMCIRCKKYKADKQEVKNAE